MRSRPTKKILLLFWLGVCALASGSAFAQESPRDRARRHFQTGESLYRAGNYRGAIAEFRAADSIVPSPILTFNIALCHERLDEPEEALRLFRSYLERRPDAPNRAAVEARIAALEKRIAEKNAPARTPDLYEELDPDLGGTIGGAATPGVAGASPPGATTPGPTARGPGPPGAVPPGAVPPGAASPGAVPPAPSMSPGRPLDPSLVRRFPTRLGASPLAPSGAGADVAPPGVGAEGAVAPSTGGLPPGASSSLSPDGAASSVGAAPQAPGAPSASGPAEPAPAPDRPEQKAKPLYKEWWFWAIVGVSAIIVIDIATHDAGAHVLGAPAAEPPSGAVLLRF